MRQRKTDRQTNRQRQTERERAGWALKRSVQVVVQFPAPARTADINSIWQKQKRRTACACGRKTDVTFEPLSRHDCKAGFETGFDTLQALLTKHLGGQGLKIRKWRISGSEEAIFAVAVECVRVCMSVCLQLKPKKSRRKTGSGKIDLACRNTAKRPYVMLALKTKDNLSLFFPRSCSSYFTPERGGTECGRGER